MIGEYHYTWSEIIERYRYWMVQRNSSAPSTIKKFQSVLNDGSEQSIKRRYGSTTGQMDNYISEGFDFPEIDANLLPETADAEGARWYFTDDSSDAEYQYDLDEAGDSEYYLKRKQVKSKPGIRIVINMGFHFGVPASRIAKYGAWVGSLISTLEAENYDLEVSMFSQNASMVTGEESSKVFIKVSEFGEQIFFRDWACFFAPGGYRHLNWMGKLSPELEGKEVAKGLGSPINTGEWGVEWQEDTRTLVLNVSKREFDADAMTQSLIEVHDLIEG